MNENDRDLILDLAEGRLSGPEAEAAQARIAASPTLRAELTTQMGVRDILAAAEPVRLTVGEQESLATALRQQLNISHEPDPAPVPIAAGSKRSRWWVPVFGLATAAAVLVGFVALGPLGGSDDSDSLEVAAASSVATTTDVGNGSTLGRSQDQPDDAGASAAEQGQEAPPTALAPGEDPATDAADTDTEAVEATTTTAAAAEETADAVQYAMDAGSDEAAVPDVADAVPPAPELYSSLERTGFSTQVASTELADDSVGEGTIAREDLVSCQAALSALIPPDLVRVEPLATGTSDGNPVVVLLLEFADSAYATATIDLTACTVVDSASATP